MLATHRISLFSHRLWQVLLGACFLVAMHPAVVQAQVFWIGGYGPGIYASRLQPDGKMAEPKLVAEQPSPSFLALHPKLDVLYAVTESNRDPSSKSGASIVAYRYDRKAYAAGDLPKLQEMNREVIHGDAPCHVVLDATGRFAIVANYTSGSVSMFPVGDDGKLLPECDTVQHRGTGPNAARQQGPHAHCSMVDPTNRWVVVADLGLDRVLVYELDAQNKKLRPSKHPEWVMAPGGGPRHLAFHPNGKTLYAINEMGMTLTAGSWDAAEGKLETISDVSTVPEGKPSEGWSTAEVLVHPTGRFVYGSNRGHNTIALFTVDQKTGAAKRVENFDTLGKTPRNFRISPDGMYLLAENQESDTVHAFKIDSATGMLRPTGHSIRASRPACIKFMLEPK